MTAKDPQKNYLQLKSLCESNGTSIFGVADLKQLRGEIPFLQGEVVSSLDYGISAGFRLSDCIIDQIIDRPTQLYFHHYKQVNYLLDRLALLVTHCIQEEGYNALPVPASQVIDRDRQTGHLSHKKVAVHAGLGWLGRNNLLVTPEYGARVRLVTVLTNMELPTGTPVETGCGQCRDCIEVCPADAIKEKAEDFDHLACFKQLDDFRKTCHIGHHICGVCVKACKGTANLTH